MTAIISSINALKLQLISDLKKINENCAENNKKF